MGGRSSWSSVPAGQAAYLDLAGRGGGVLGRPEVEFWTALANLQVRQAFLQPAPRLGPPP